MDVTTVAVAEPEATAVKLSTMVTTMQTRMAAGAYRAAAALEIGGTVDGNGNGGRT